jgi:hypothetical protein
MPLPNLPVSSSSSILGVDVVHLAHLLPDPHPDDVFFLREPSGGGGPENRGEVIRASWINGKRAYLLNPEPGTYYVVAAGYSYALPTQSSTASVGSHVSVSISVAGRAAYVIVFPDDLIHETQTTIAPSCVTFMGGLRFLPGDRVNANAQLQGDLQRHVAEVLVPGSTSASGFSGYLTRIYMVNLEKSSVSNETSNRENFMQKAADDFAKSSFSQIVSNPALCPAGS